MPPLPLPVLHGGAVARAGQKTTGMVGVGIVFRQGERTQGTVADIDPIGIDVIFRARACVLQIIPVFMLCHPRALDERRIGEHASDHRLSVIRNLILSHASGSQECPHLRVGLFLSERLKAVIFSRALKPDFKRTSLDQNLFFSLWKHRFRVQFHAPDRGGVGAAPVEIDPAVVIDKQIGIPKGKVTRYFFIRPVQNIPCAPAIAAFIPAGSTEIYPLAHHTHVRGIIIQRQLPGKPMVLPMRQVIRHPHAQGHGRKDVIAALKADHGGVCRFTTDFHISALALIQIELIPIVHIHRIAKVPHYFSSCAVS